MNTRMLRLLPLLALLPAALLAFEAAPPHRAWADTPVQVTVKIADTGFDPVSVQVDQGASVELTFAFAQTTYTNDQHVIALDGYNVQTDQIDSDHPQSTMKFVAAKTGNFSFKCVIECAIHPALQNGVLKVVAGGSGVAAVSLLKPNLVVNPSLVSLDGDSEVLAAQLLDPSGQPIAKAEVDFLVQEQFLNWSGLAEVGTAKTGAAGIAQVTYRPSQPDPQKLVVRFPGAGQYDAAEVDTVTPINRLAAPPPPEATVSLHGLRSWAPFALLIVIAGIWVVFVVLLFEVCRLPGLRS